MRKERVRFKKLKIDFLANIFCIILCCVHALSSCLSPEFVLIRAHSTCIVALVTNSCLVDNQIYDNSHFSELKKLTMHKDLGILVGYIDINSKWPDGKSFYGEGVEAGKIVLFKKIPKDRTCLLPSPSQRSMVPLIFNGVNGLATLIDFVNDGCNTYMSPTGGPSIEGLHKNEIHRTRFYVQNISNVQSKDVFQPVNQNCKVEDQSCSSDNHNFHFHNNIPRIPECERIDFPSREDFFHNYVKISKPVIFKNALRDWPAFTKWSNRYFREKFGKNDVHIKLTPLGEYEGVEPRYMWENHENFEIPKSVEDQLPFPDLVVVRPATKNMNFSSFMDIVEGVSNGTINDMSAYLEYSSIPDHLPELEEDLRDDLLFQGLLNRKHLNIWLSDGRTLGKLHFDQFDNLLCQISGKKQVILFDPHNNHQMYEGHIPEAILSYSQTSNTFYRRNLLESTSMVMSPVDIQNPDYSRFPLFGETYPLNCTIEDGDILYMPSFWWHEVQSFPNKTAGRNLAINFWYDPFLVREYPCPECQLDVNPKYRHLL
ncbi:uncharacterized protein LOC133185401 [Saccostrea echinata]|uniref:uncharacterized protein LOC133185401 n=1 Tax=Saccostrea echinata TaxID=191078 RepID=UPI002A81FFC0|nr:uncharacterized protein LOC133185401 [Saccostrea echinata]